MQSTIPTGNRGQQPNPSRSQNVPPKPNQTPPGAAQRPPQSGNPQQRPPANMPPNMMAAIMQAQNANPIDRAQHQLKTMLSHIGMAFNSAVPVHERREQFSANYPILSNKFQEYLDPLEDELCHAKQVMRGLYAVFLEKKAKAKEEEDKVKAKEDEERKKKEEAERRKKQDDVVMIDTPAPAPVTPAPLPVSAAATPVMATPSNPPTVLPPANATPSGKTPAAMTPSALANIPAPSVPGDLPDFDSFFQDSVLPSTTTPNAAIPTTSPPDLPSTPFGDSSDLASLIPGIDTYASMDAGSKAAVTTQPDVSMSEAPAVDLNAGELDLGEDEFNLAFLEGGDDTQMADSTDFDSWLNGLDGS